MIVVVYLLQLYWFVLVARLVMEIAQSLNPHFRPRGAWAVAFDIVYTLTDPVLKPLRRLIPPLRIGNFALDLAFLVVFIGLQVLAQNLPT